MKNVGDLLQRMPMGLDRDVLSILAEHQGKANQIERNHFLRAARERSGRQRLSDRKLRQAVQNLRSMGVRVCNCEFEDRLSNGHLTTRYGYYLPASDAEYLEFRSYYAAYAVTINEIIKAMNQEKPIRSKRDVLSPADRARQEKLL